MTINPIPSLQQHDSKPLVPPPFEPSFGLNLQDFYSQTGASKIDQLFVDQLQVADSALHHRLTAARANPSALNDLESSQLLLDVAPALEDFIAVLFKIAGPLDSLRQKHSELAPIFLAKRKFVQRLSLRAISADEAMTFDEQDRKSVV